MRDDRYLNSFQHAWSNRTEVELLNFYVGVAHRRFNDNSLRYLVLIFNGNKHFVAVTSANRTELAFRRQDVEPALERVVKHRGDHCVGVVNKVCESLLLLNCRQDHLVLALLADLLRRRSVDVLASCHRRNLYTTIGDALGGDEFLVQFRRCVTFLDRFHKRFVVP